MQRLPSGACLKHSREPGTWSARCRKRRGLFRIGTQGAGHIPGIVARHATLRATHVFAQLHFHSYPCCPAPVMRAALPQRASTVTTACPSATLNIAGNSHHYRAAADAVLPSGEGAQRGRSQHKGMKEILRTLLCGAGQLHSHRARRSGSSGDLPMKTLCDSPSCLGRPPWARRPQTCQLVAHCWRQTVAPLHIRPHLNGGFLPRGQLHAHNTVLSLRQQTGGLSEDRTCTAP